MDVIPERQGTEFDWFAVDEIGDVAVFATGGIGPVPAQVRTDPERHDALAELIDVSAWGTSAVWESYSKAGLFAYDWNDPLGCYSRVAQPDRGVTTDTRSKLAALLLPRVELSFRNSPKIDADETVV
jgi:hypothetical protein